MFMGNVLDSNYIENDEQFVLKLTKLFFWTYPTYNMIRCDSIRSEYVYNHI